VTIIYDPRDPATSNLEDDWAAWHSHWFLLGAGLFVLAIPVPALAEVFEADGPVGRRLARQPDARRQAGTPPTPPGPIDHEPPPARARNAPHDTPGGTAQDRSHDRTQDTPQDRPQDWPQDTPQDWQTPVLAAGAVPGSSWNTGHQGRTGTGPGAAYRRARGLGGRGGPDPTPPLLPDSQARTIRWDWPCSVVNRRTQPRCGPMERDAASQRA
jgi:hypothetical protein